MNAKLAGVSEGTKKSSGIYRFIAIGLVVFGGVVVGLAWWLYGEILGKDLSTNASDWGIFGDYLGGVAGTFLVLATLVALSITLHLQAKELAETSKALRDQVVNQKGYEARRIQPVLKAEWGHGPGKYDINWFIRNVGMGTAIIDRIELKSDPDHLWSHEFDSRGKAGDVWREALAHVLGDAYRGDHEVRILPLHNLKRGIAVREDQAIVIYQCGSNVNPASTMRALDEKLSPVIYFRSLAGTKTDTNRQFEPFEVEFEPFTEETASPSESL